MKKVTSRNVLQCVIGILAAAPLLSGILGLSGIFNPLFSRSLPENIVLDSNLRFLNAMSVAVALSFYFLIPVIEKETFACRVICFAVFFGGIGRLISVHELGTPPFPLLAFLTSELLFPMLIIIWQQKIASEYTKRSSL